LLKATHGGSERKGGGVSLARFSQYAKPARPVPAGAWNELEIAPCRSAYWPLAMLAKPGAVRVGSPV